MFMHRIKISRGQRAGNKGCKSLGLVGRWGGV
jgi:hypothetical protein